MGRSSFPDGGTPGTQPPATRYQYGGAWGYETDPEYNGIHGSGVPYLHVGHRYYDPASGRFVQRDPIGRTGGDNAYSYANHSPTSWIDPDGLFQQQYWPGKFHFPDGKYPKGLERQCKQVLKNAVKWVGGPVREPSIWVPIINELIFVIQRVPLILVNPPDPNLQYPTNPLNPRGPII